MDLKIFKLAANTKNRKLLKDCDYVLRQKNTFCGDEVTISINAKSKKVYKIGYSCKSCIYTQASASLLSDFFKNKSVIKAAIIVITNISSGTKNSKLCRLVIKLFPTLQHN